MANEIIDIQTAPSVTPTAVPTATPTAENGMTPEEMTSDLKQRLAGVESAHKAVKTKQIVGENEIEEMRGEMIRSLFSLMEKYGVNLSDQSSVQNFLAELEANDPDLYDMFDIAFNNLVGKPAETEEAEQPGLNGMTNLGTMPVTEGAQPATQTPEVGPGDLPPTTPANFTGLTNAMRG